MGRHLAWIFIAVSLCLTLASCGTTVDACNVADACISQCTEECAPDPLVSVACVGNACNCVCDQSGGGGMGGGGGMSGAAGMSGAGGQ
jgi:hypothetical protein